MLEELEPLSPINFFSLSGCVKYAKKLPATKIMARSFFLPDTSTLLGEDDVLRLALAWNEEGLLLDAFVDEPWHKSVYPNYTEGDSFEIFIDTRDLKTAGFLTKFCHHFLILPQEVQGIRAQEMTRFRTEDSHPLCDPDDIILDTDVSTSSYRLKIMLPSESLQGYQPNSFDRLGFAFRLNRYGKEPVHFCVSSKDYAIEQHPSLWSSIKLVK